MAIDIPLQSCRVRSWRVSDAESLARYANNRKIWLNLRDLFPHPYGIRDARAYLQMVLGKTPETSFAIDVQGEAAGGVGFVLKTDVERVSAEIGSANRSGAEALSPTPWPRRPGTSWRRII
jgi:ribosomal-protein-alanine N-acetyltransferase